MESIHGYHFDGDPDAVKYLFDFATEDEIETIIHAVHDREKAYIQDHHHTHYEVIVTQEDVYMISKVGGSGGSSWF